MHGLRVPVFRDEDHVPPDDATLRGGGDLLEGAHVLAALEDEVVVLLVICSDDGVALGVRIGVNIFAVLKSFWGKDPGQGQFINERAFIGHRMEFHRVQRFSSRLSQSF